MDLFCFGPQYFYDPQFQILCCYIARYYVKIMHVCLGAIKHIFPLSWGGGGQNRSTDRYISVECYLTFVCCFADSALDSKCGEWGGTEDLLGLFFIPSPLSRTDHVLPQIHCHIRVDVHVLMEVASCKFHFKYCQSSHFDCKNQQVDNHERFNQARRSTISDSKINLVTQIDNMLTC